MALVTNITKTIKILNEDETCLIRKLSHIQLKQAAKARQSEGIGFMREMGGELLKALREGDNEKIKKLEEAQAANVTNYDRDSLLRFGILSWTYPVPPMAPTPFEPNAKRGADGIDDLDEPTAKFLAEEIFNYSRPETPAEAKNE